MVVDGIDFVKILLPSKLINNMLAVLLNWTLKIAGGQKQKALQVLLTKLMKMSEKYG